MSYQAAQGKECHNSQGYRNSQGYQVPKPDWALTDQKPIIDSAYHYTRLHKRHFLMILYIDTTLDLTPLTLFPVPPRLIT